MSEDELSEDDVLALLESNDTPTRPAKAKEKLTTEEIRQKYPIPPSYGPLQWYDKTFSCANKDGLHSRECGSSTACKLLGIPKCTIHAMIDMNRMLYELIEGKELPANSSHRSGRESKFRIIYEGEDVGN